MASVLAKNPIQAFIRGLGLCYLIHFASVLFQFDAILGRDGILPMTDFLASFDANFADRLITLSVFQVYSADWFVKLWLLIGVGLSFLLIFFKVRWAFLLYLFVLQVSITNASGPFFRYIWDICLVEAGFVSLFLHLPLDENANASSQPNFSLALKWLCFRLFFGMGYVKFFNHSTEGITWDSGLFFKHFSFAQPMPSIVSWFAFQIADRLEGVVWAATFLVEITLPFLLFAPRRFVRLRLAAFIFNLVFQASIFILGNFGYFNILSTVISLAYLLDWGMPKGLRWYSALIFGGWLLSGFCILGHMLTRDPQVAFADVSWLSPNSKTPSKVPLWAKNTTSLFAATSLANSYELFSNLPHQPYETTVMGSYNGNDWLPIRAFYKPSNSREIAGMWAPFQARLDHQLYYEQYKHLGVQSFFIDFFWLDLFAEALTKKGSPIYQVLSHTPFSNRPPTHVRFELRPYQFGSVTQRKYDGSWWRLGEGKIIFSFKAGDLPKFDKNHFRERYNFHKFLAKHYSTYKVD